ncbi:MAG: hypothetical protein LiPW15_405 [Parcubacteria group bacterium LiPW_15]|nr:MAG: hypothetical protein LiPW15_405 [Parcubacteria group bacterium LiPW_15]
MPKFFDGRRKKPVKRMDVRASLNEKIAKAEIAEALLEHVPNTSFLGTMPWHRFHVAVSRKSLRELVRSFGGSSLIDDLHLDDMI